VNVGNSLQSLLPKVFAYTDYRTIGTHENARGANTNTVYDAMKEQGYKGPALCVFSAGDDSALQNLKPESIIPARYGLVGIADGHNRLEALRLLDEEGLLRSRYVPVQVMPAHDQSVIRISTRDLDDPALQVKDIERHFVVPGSVISTINSYFETKLKDGSWVPLSEAQPDVLIPKKMFLINS
jgi:hypothetical protein